jgi:hypothetical protein
MGTFQSIEPPASPAQYAQMPECQCNSTFTQCIANITLPPMPSMTPYSSLQTVINECTNSWMPKCASNATFLSARKAVDECMKSNPLPPPLLYDSPFFKSFHNNYFRCSTSKNTALQPPSATLNQMFTMKQLMDCVTLASPALEQQWQSLTMSQATTQIVKCATDNRCRPVVIPCSGPINTLAAVMMTCV